MSTSLLSKYSMEFIEGVKLLRKNVGSSWYCGNQYFARKRNYIFLQSGKNVQHALKPLTCKRFISWSCLIMFYFLSTWLLGIPFNTLATTGILSLGTYFKNFRACHLIFWILCKLNQTCNPIDAQKCTRSKLFCILQVIQEQDQMNSARNILLVLNISLKNFLIDWISISRKLQDGILKSHIIQHHYIRTYLSNDILPIQCLQIDHEPRFCWHL